jgi:hypothetical protein
MGLAVEVCDKKKFDHFCCLQNFPRGKVEFEQTTVECEFSEYFLLSLPTYLFMLETIYFGRCICSIIFLTIKNFEARWYRKKKNEIVS